MHHGQAFKTTTLDLPAAEHLIVLSEIGNFFSVPVTFGLGFFCRIAEMKTFCDTLGYTGRFQALINSVHAVIALHGFTGLRVPLGSSPWAGRNTGFAADAKGGVYEDDAVLGPFLHRAGRTGGNTPRFLAVKTGHKYIRHAR